MQQHSVVAESTLGFTDGVNTAVAIAAGMVASGQFTNYQIVLVTIAETVSGALSMGLSRFMSLDTGHIDNVEAAYASSMVSVGFIIGTLMTIVAFRATKTPQNGFKLAVALTLVVVCGFGYVRGVLLEQGFFYAIGKLIFICTIATVATYVITRHV